MSTLSVGIRAMAVSFPENIRTNDYWRENHPELLARAEEQTLAKLWATEHSTPESREFDEEMQPYVADPFRGTVERRILSPGELPSQLESKAIRDVLAAAELSPRDVDLMIVGSFLPDRIGNGNGPFLARELGFRGAVWNIESACSTTLPALQSACAMVRSGEYRQALVVVSCSYSRVTDPSDTLSWFLGDGAGAWLIGAMEPGQGVLGTKIVHTGESCGAAWYEPTMTPDGRFRAMMRSGKNTGRLFRDTAKGHLLHCCHAAVQAAGVRLEDIRLFAFNTPTAWYARFGARCLGIDPARTIDVYPLFGNIGPALPTTNLYHAARAQRIREDDLVLVYCIGSVSTAGAVVMRWGDVKLGPPPARGAAPAAAASAETIAKGGTHDAR